VEFVILFVWREPTTLEGTTEAAPEAAAPME
jgi:hypothetical protein